ncbi:hypothetical protein VNO78_31199 [Psophocarpus tetragonolobus]|uniref:Uncharacterized protein n=1 Tax=Psophocarpus tetragonolobus TaxID=3891 RepID=A0AAN9RY19_PSOTE
MKSANPPNLETELLSTVATIFLSQRRSNNYGVGRRKHGFGLGNAVLEENRSHVREDAAKIVQPCVSEIRQIGKSALGASLCDEKRNEQLRWQQGIVRRK